MTIHIRRATPDDLEAVYNIYTGPLVIRGTLQLPFPSIDRWRKRLEPQDGVIPLVACVDEEIVGHLSLMTFTRSPRRRHAGTLGMAVRDDWQGRGVGSTLMTAVIDLADRWLNLTRLELEVFCDNASAVGLYKKFGFQIEGTLRAYAFRDGEYADVYAMARLREPNDISKPPGGSLPATGEKSE